MIRDITIGQYYPAESPIHRIDARVKTVITLLYIISLFVINSFVGYAVVIASLAVTLEGVFFAIKMCLRIILLIVGSSLLTLTTTPIKLTDGIESLLKPLEKIGVPAHDIAMMMTIALRFIPTLLDETDKIIKAQQARGADFDTGSLASKAKALVPILVPLFISAFRRAEELAMAMEARCYGGSVERTRMNVMKISSIDYVAVAVFVVYFAVLVAIRIFIG